MNLETLGAYLEIVYPTTYWSWPEGEAPAMPYLVYFEEGTNNFGADNKVFHFARRIYVELLTEKKDPAAEANVEALLDGLDIFWTKEETHLDDEDAFEVIYSMEV